MAIVAFAANGVYPAPCHAPGRFLPRHGPGKAPGACRRQAGRQTGPIAPILTGSAVADAPPDSDGGVSSARTGRLPAFAPMAAAV
ncbi:hypothetical protein GCM10009078_20310 [Cupriavidus gilardii]